MRQLIVEQELTDGILYHLKIYMRDNGEKKHIGDYERSKEEQISRKLEEIERSKDFLIGIFESYGKFVVRWVRPEKQIRKYQEGQANPGLGAPLIDVLPKRYWQN